MSLDGKPINACYFPALTTGEDLARYKAQAAWYLAPLDNAINITFPETDMAAAKCAKTADVIFFWQKGDYWAAPALLRRKGVVVDEFAQQAVGDALDAYTAQYVMPDCEGHKEAFMKAVKTQRPTIEHALIIGSGPDMTALETLDLAKLQNTLTLYLSTSVLNEAACAACPPDIIIAVDGPSQFGPSKTGQRYRERAAQLVARYGCLILVPLQHLPSIRAHWPAEIQDYVFAVPLSRKVKLGHRFSTNWQYEPTSNVLTSFGLPCAASFTQNIQFAGVSIRPGPEKINPRMQHWEHIDESLYQRHVAPMLAWHPAAGQDNASYLDRHHARLTQDLAAYSATGFSFSHLSGEALDFDKSHAAPSQETTDLPFKVRLFEGIAKAQHYPKPIIFAVFILAGLLGAGLQYTIGLRMTGFFILGGLAAFLVAGVLFLRIRQNRIAARLESKLSQQQAQQFANLSERLEALERQK